MNSSSASELIALPILIPLTVAALMLLVRRSRFITRALNVLGSVSLLVTGMWLLTTVSHEGILTVQIGSWPAPFGITFVADMFSAVMVLMAGIIGSCVAIYSLWDIDENREAFNYYPLYQFLLMGVNGAFLTGDIFNLYVWFEVMLMASFALMTLGNEKGQIIGGIKYVVLNLVSSAFFLTGVGILYGLTGTLNMADLALKLQAVPVSATMTLAMLFLIAFGIKGALFPLFFWLPASYHRPPVAVSAVFSGLLTKVGVYALVRVFTLLFIQNIEFTHGLILVIAAVTMLTGVLGAVAQYEFRRLLSFHIISQIGYMVMGLGLLTPLGLAGSVYFVAHNIFAKTNLFFVSGLVSRTEGSFDLKSLGGVYRTHPGLAVIFLVSALSLAGLPPLSGFLGKLVLVKAALDAQRYGMVIFALGVSILTLVSMTKIWREAFWKTPMRSQAETAGEQPGQGHAPRWMAYGPMGVLAALTVALGVFGEPCMAIALKAAEQLLNPQGYITAVLGQ